MWARELGKNSFRQPPLKWTGQEERGADDFRIKSREVMGGAWIGDKINLGKTVRRSQTLKGGENKAPVRRERNEECVSRGRGPQNLVEGCFLQITDGEKKTEIERELGSSQ